MKTNALLASLDAASFSVEFHSAFRPFDARTGVFEYCRVIQAKKENNVSTEITIIPYLFDGLKSICVSTRA